MKMTSYASVACGLAVLLGCTPPLTAETNEPAIQPVEGPCFARFVPERKDDFAWENDRIAFRMYGPALGIAEPNHCGSGIDVWAKKVRYPVINKWYASGHYHRDHGEGLDFYKVGTSRGCGGLGIWNGSGLDTSGVFAQHKVIKGEGDAVAFELHYGPWTSGEATVSEVKHIRLEKGTNLFEARSTFKVEGADKVTVGIGLVLRDKEGGELRHGDNWIAYIEPRNRRHGRMYCAVILPTKAEYKKTDDHALLLTPVADGETIAYRAGAAWDKGLDFKSPEAWFDYVMTEAKQSK